MCDYMTMNHLTLLNPKPETVKASQGELGKLRETEFKFLINLLAMELKIMI